MWYIVNAFGICQQQLQLWYWMPLKVCMHVQNLFYSQFITFNIVFP
jgi:hypothetical protein